MKNKTLWIAETAVMIALLVALQWATKPLGQFVTGSCVNLVLGVSTLVGGAWCGAVVAIASPFCAFLVGVGPAKLVIVPFIAVGNLVLVLLLHFIAGGKPLGLRSYLAVAAAAVCKFAVLFLLVTKVAIPSLQLPEAAAATMSASFSWPQLVTAAIGGLIAVTISPVMDTAISSGVTALMAVPTGVWTKAMAFSAMPASRSRWLTKAVFFREPMTPT